MGKVFRNYGFGLFKKQVGLCSSWLMSCGCARPTTSIGTAADLL